MIGVSTLSAQFLSIQFNRLSEILATAELQGFYFALDGQEVEFSPWCVFWTEAEVYF